MELKTLLKQFKNIEPDREYSRRSRESILGTPIHAPYTNVWQFLVHNIQLGAAMALTGLILLALGGFSFWKYLSPFRLSSLDPVSLHAEADAIDIQIQLTRLKAYSEQNIHPALKNAASTSSTVPAPVSKEVKAEAQNLGLDSLLITPISETTSSLGVDDALRILSQ